MRLIIFSLLFLGVLIGCGTPENNGTKTKDETKKVEQPEKIVSLNGTVTEIIFAFGANAQLVGRDVTSTFPADKVQDIPNVGHVRNAKAEGIISLMPDKVLIVENELSQEVANQLKSAGVEIVSFKHEHTVEGAKRLITDVAKELGKEEEVSSIHTKIEKRLTELEKIEVAPKVLFIYARGAATLMVAGDNTKMKAAIELAGGQNAVTGFEEFKPLTPEALAEANPDAILMFKSGAASVREESGVINIPGYEQTTAGKNGNIITMDGLKLSGFGPRVGEAIAELNQALAEIEVIKK